MPPTTSTKDRQFAFILSAEEHEMLTTLAEAGEVSASEWLRGAIRGAHQEGKLETLPQRIRRTWQAFEAEHTDYLRRWKRVSDKGHNVTPSSLALQRKFVGLEDLVDRTAKRKRDLRQALQPYETALHGARNAFQDPPKGQAALESAFDQLEFDVDEWLDAAKAEEGK